MTGTRPLVRRLAVVLGAALLSTSGSSRADGTADEADAHFRMGMEDARKAAYDSALTHFFQSNRLAPNRNVLFNIASTYEAMGRYSDAHRYFVDALVGETDSGRRSEVQAAIARMAAKVAVLEVVTDPPGATIYLERKDLGSVGKAPRPLALPPGKYHVLAELEGYESVTSAEVTTALGQQTKVSLVLPRIVGRVQIATESGVPAAVRLDADDGTLLCTTPCEADLPPGRHDLFFHADGFELVSRSAVVEAKKTVALRVSLTPQTGSLVIKTEDRDAVVYVDGKPVGFTPLVAQGIPAGRRAVRVELRGFKPYETNVDIRPGKQLELPNVTLVPVHEVTAASRSTESVDDAPSSVTIIDRRELDAFGYPTVAEAVRGVRGFTLSNDGVYTALGVRGLGQPNDYGNRILMLFDGHPINDNVSSTGPAGHDQRVDLHDVDRIEIVRGPGSLLYGTGAFSGVVNLVTRPTDAASSIHAGAGVYDDHIIHGRAGFQYTFGPQKSVWASVQAAYSPGSDVNFPDPSAPDAPRAAHGVDAFAGAGTEGRATFGAFTAQWFYYEQKQHLPFGAYGTVFNDPDSSVQDRRMMTEIRYEPQISERLRVFARVHANHYEYHGLYDYDFDGDLLQDTRAEDAYTGTWFGGEARLIYTPRSWLRLTLGGEAQAHAEAQLYGRVTQPTVDPPYLQESRPYGVGSGYFLAEGSPAQWFRFSAGVRLDGYTTFGAIFVPRLALLFRPAEDHTIKVMGGRAFRAASIFEQLYNDGGVAVARAEGLGPESIYSGEAEYSVRFARDFAIVAAAHGSFAEGLIVTVPDGTAVRYANSMSPVLLLGGDLEIRREWRRGLFLSASYGYQQARLLGTAAPDAALVNAPEHLASFKCVVPVITDLASLGFRATLEAPRRISEDSSARTDAAVVADATISGAIRGLGLKYVVGVYNLADFRYVLPAPDFASGVVPQKGRTFLVDFLWTWQ